MTTITPREEKTELLYGVEAAVGRGVQFMKNVKIGMDLFGEKNGPSIIMEFDVYKNNYADVLKRGGKIRFITEITKENLHYCEYMSTTTLREKELLAQVFYSNAHEVVEQGQYIFDTFWQKAIPMEDRVREIKEGIKPEFIETIRDPTRVQNIALDLVRTCKEEILTIFSTSNAFFRQQRAGGIVLLNDVATHGEVNIRILVPYDRRIREFISSLNANIIALRKNRGQKK